MRLRVRLRASDGLLLGVIGFSVVGAPLIAADALTQRFNWFTVIVWTALIPFMIGLGVWQVAGIIEGQAREIARLRREIELLERAIDQELARTIPKGS
jgi:hypothetical protein